MASRMLHALLSASWKAEDSASWLFALRTSIEGNSTNQGRTAHGGMTTYHRRTTPFSPRNDLTLTTPPSNLLNLPSTRIDPSDQSAATAKQGKRVMSEDIVCDPAAEDGAEFADLLQARCPEMQVLTGAVGSTSSRERSHSEIQIVIPGERAVAEIVYRTPEGSVRRQAMSERQISIIPAGQPHQLLCARGTDLTVVRIASDLLKRIARESGMRA